MTLFIIVEEGIIHVVKNNNKIEKEANFTPSGWLSVVRGSLAAVDFPNERAAIT